MDHITLTPTHYFPAPPRLTSHSHSQSPSRRQYFTNQELNPLLSDLSPSSTLEALQSNDILRTGGETGKSFIQESVASASTSERAWGIKAALTGKKVREWYTEIGGWAWPGFDQPPLAESTNRHAQHHRGHSDRSVSAETTRSSGSNVNGKQKVEALSSKLIHEYEERIEIIRDDLETLEIEDLKDYVRNTHFKASSRRSSLNYSQASFALETDYDHLDDFTAVITATIVQALPTISRLERLLNTWSTRLLVLRQVPSFLADLDAGRESMVSASIAIGAHNAQPTKQRSDFSRKAFSDIRAVLQDQIAELGRRLDRMLDLLEGSADTLPDAWVDELDNMENQYSAWVVKAERLAMNKEIRLWKDYTQDHTDELLDLGMERPLDIQHTTSTLDIGAQFDEIRRQADSEFDMTRQAPAETVKPENGADEFSTEHSAGPFDLEPFSSRSALPKQDLSNEAQVRRRVGNSAESQSFDGFSDGLGISSLPIRSSHRPTPLILADSEANLKRPDSPDTASDSSGSGSATSNYSSNKSSPKIESAVVAEYMGSPVRVTSPPLLNREHITQETEGGGARMIQNGASSDLVSKNARRSGGPGHVRTRSASLQSFEVVPKHEIRRIQVRRSGSYSSALSLSDPECGLVRPSKLPTTSAPHHGEPEALRKDTPLPASENGKNQQSSAPAPAPAQNPDPILDMPKQQPLYHPPPPVSVRSSVSAQSSNGDFRTPKQQFLYHPPPPVSVRSSMSSQSSNGEFQTSKQQSLYYPPPAGSVGSSVSAQSSNGKSHTPKQQSLYHLPLAGSVGLSVSAQSSNGESHTPKQQYLYHPPPPVSVRSSMSARSSSGEFHMPKQQDLYHPPPPVAVRSSMSTQISNEGSYTPKEQPLYHRPPPVSARSSISAQSSDWESSTSKQQLPYHSPPAIPPRPTQPAQSLDQELDLAEHRISYHSPPPVPPRSAHRFEQVSDLGPGATPVEIRQMKMGDPIGGHIAEHVRRPPTTLSPSNLDDQLEERISSILTELPTQIRLTSGPEPDAPEVKCFDSPSDSRTPKTHTPPWRLKRTQTSTPLPSMTLAPAQPKSSKSRSQNGEPDIKLYHLHQTGKTAPIKLFVRLVGEGGERVMVRIGGGWADLGEYLREYASHHGRRSVSDSPFDIQGLPSSPLTNQSTSRSRPGSRPASRLGSTPGSTPGSRPTSPTSSTKQSFANRLARQQTSPAIFDSPRTPQSDASLRNSPFIPWAGTDEASPSLGLAGPKTKNVDISPEGQAWVDELMEQARQSGPEKTGGSESTIGDLGKVGGTKRVFFKNRKEG